MILEGNITIPYKWTTGATVGRFLAELKENARLVGARCESCSKVYVPPADICGECYKPLDAWVPLTGEGTVVAVTTVERATPWSPQAAPYTLALVHLDGADTELLHLAKPNLKAGDRVVAVFKTERAGSLLDIKGFAAASESAASAEDAQQIEDGEVDAGTPSQLDSSGEATTPRESISEVSAVFHALPGRFRKEKVDEALTFYFSIDAEQWTVIITTETCEVLPGKPVDDADCYLKTTTAIFLGTLNGTYKPSMTDLIMGRVKTNKPFLLKKFREAFG